MSEQVITPPPVKPGWKTSEFWLRNIAILLSVLIYGDVIPSGGQAMKICMIGALWLSAEGYTVSRTIIKNGAALFFAFLVIHSTACGPNTADKALQNTLTGAEAAQIAFVTYDGFHQHDIVMKAATEQEGEQRLHEWRGTQLTIEQRFTELYHAIAAAAVLKQDPTASGVVKALSILQNDLRQLGVPL